MGGIMNIVTNGNMDDGYETIITMSKSGERKIEITLTENDDALNINAKELKFVVNNVILQPDEINIKSAGVVEIDLSKISLEGMRPFSLALTVDNEEQELLNGYIDVE